MGSSLVKIMIYETAVLFVVIAGVGYGLGKLVRRVTVFEYERGLRYDKGKYVKLLGAGNYWYFSYHTTIKKIDIRPRYQTIPSQEVLSKDGVAVKLSLVANIEIVKPDTAINSVSNYEEAFYLILQLALRKATSTTEIDKLIANRQALGKVVFETANKEIEELGMKLVSIDIKDITFPGSLKQTFAQAVKARHEGLAALERARGESAALRNLANSAKLLEQNPALMNLRTIQSFNESSGNTLVLNLSSEQVTPLKSPEHHDSAENS